MCQHIGGAALESTLKLRLYSREKECGFESHRCHQSSVREEVVSTLGLRCGRSTSARCFTNLMGLDLQILVWKVHVESCSPICRLPHNRQCELSQLLVNVHDFSAAGNLLQPCTELLGASVHVGEMAVQAASKQESLR